MMILKNLRVLDFSQYLAGPTITRLMAEMGAEIIKIEIAPTGDPSRGLPISDRGRSGYFVQQNRGKKSLCLDLNQPAALQILRELVTKVDVVVENFGPGVLEKRGLGYEDLRTLKPDLIMVSLSAYGRESPLAHKTGYDWAAQAFAGLMHMTGDPDGPPTPIGVALGDIGSGVHGFAALGYALFHRAQTGEGQWLDVAMVDSMFHLQDIALQANTLSKGAFTSTRMGSHHAWVCPFGVFKGPSGYLVILALHPQWQNVCAALGRPDLQHDPRFAEAGVRAVNQQALIAIIQEWLDGFPDNDAVFQHLEQHRVPAAPVLNPVEALNHPYFAAREMVRHIEDPILGPMSIPGTPFRFPVQPERPDLVAPVLGEHNDVVLSELLGYDQSRIMQLCEAGVLVKGAR